MAGAAGIPPVPRVLGEGPGPSEAELPSSSRGHLQAPAAVWLQRFKGAQGS